MRNNIIDICNKYVDRLELPPYEDRGVFNSEMLLACSIMAELDLKAIVESGRANGHSTEIIARFFPNKKFYSIDTSNKVTKDFSRYNNLELVTGDSTQIIGDYIKEDCAVFIDGPKGEKALKLAKILLCNETVKVIFIHDLYSPSPERKVAEKAFENIIFSDDEKFVSKFSYLDKDCWETLKRIGGIPERPYIRRNREIISYASTLAVIFNRSIKI